MKRFPLADYKKRNYSNWILIDLTGIWARKRVVFCSVSLNSIYNHVLLVWITLFHLFISLLNFGIQFFFSNIIRKNILSVFGLFDSPHKFSMYSILFSVCCCCCCFCYLSFFHTFASVSSKLTNALPEMIWYTLLVRDFNRNYCLSRWAPYVWVYRIRSALCIGVFFFSSLSLL